MPVDRGALDAQLREIGEGERWWEQREFRDLPYILHPDEQIRGLVNGKLLGRWRPRLTPRGRWMIAVTNLRVLCLKQERFSRRQIEIPADQIHRVRHRGRFRSVQITVETSERRVRIRVAKADAFRIAAALAQFAPALPAHQANPDLERLSWIPGMTTVAAIPGVAGVVAMLSPPEYATREYVGRLETTVDQLREDVDRLQQQVAFLEDLLQQRAEKTVGVG